MIAFHDAGRCPEQNRPICIQPSTYVKYWLSKDGAMRLIRHLEAAILQVPLFPDPVELTEAKNRPGVEMVVANLKSNNRAYNRRVALEKRGFICRTRRIGPGQHLVYAIWPVELAQKVER